VYIFASCCLEGDYTVYRLLVLVQSPRGKKMLALIVVTAQSIFQLLPL
jgi:hypothetical protein